MPAEQVYSDPQRVLYDRLQLIEKLGSMNRGQSKHIKSSLLGGLASSTFRGLKSMKMQGNVKQQGGALVIQPPATLLYAHQDQSPSDHADIDSLLLHAGCQPFFDPEYKLELESPAASEPEAAATQPVTLASC
eukprot:m.153007 g.153007  ORF g.153007 m.153007 type:complete len:133 (+) comp16365_c0_seq9:1545-1943(+)